MAVPQVLSELQVMRCKTYARELSELLGVKDSINLKEAQLIEQKLVNFLAIVRYNIERVTVPQNDAPGMPNDIHGAASR